MWYFFLFCRNSGLRSPTVITGGRADRRRKMEEKKENKTLENLKAERERKKNKAGKIYQCILNFYGDASFENKTKTLKED